MGRWKIRPMRKQRVASRQLVKNPGSKVGDNLRNIG